MIKYILFMFLILLLTELALFIVVNISRLFRVSPKNTPTKFFDEFVNGRSKLL